MEILKADKAYKHKCLKLIVLLGVIGLLLVVYALPRAEEFIQNMPPEEGFDFLLNLLTFLFLFLSPWGLYLCLFAKRIYKTGQFPPIGQKVLRDTRVYRGKSARQWALLLLIIGVTLIVMSFFCAIYFPANLRKANQTDGNVLGASRKTKSNCGSMQPPCVATAYREPLGS